MKKNRIFYSTLQLFAVIGIMLIACKKEKNTTETLQAPENNARLFTCFTTMELAHDKIIEIGERMDVTPRVAMYHTMKYLETVDGVEHVEFFDSAYLVVTTTGGYQSTMRVDELTTSGESKFRGGGAGTSQLAAYSRKRSDDKEISNKKVLLYAADEDGLYTSTGEFERRVVDRIRNSAIDVEITVLKNEQCTPDIVRSFDQYGLVIIDGHGVNNGFISGMEFLVRQNEIPSTVDSFFTVLESKIGTAYVKDFRDQRLSFGYAFEYDPELQNQEIWNNYKNRIAEQYEVIITSKGIREMVPSLKNTIVFPNSCYSGWGASQYAYRKDGPLVNIDAVKSAWLSKDPLTLYAYDAGVNISYKAPNDFCKFNEDSLIQSLFYDNDNTGNAHLLGSKFISETPWHRDLFRIDEGPLKWNHYGRTEYKYKPCGEPFTDDRDGKVYKTVCIGKQVWMAENLNWGGAGVCYDNAGANCGKYGRLYTIDEATGRNLSTNAPVKGVCPKGWHVPSGEEWQELITFCGGSDAASKKLKSKTGWEAPNENTDEFGFNLLPSGHYNGDEDGGSFSYLGKDAKVWASSGANGRFEAINGYGTSFSIGNYSPPPSFEWKFSCRCLKD